MKNSCPYGPYITLFFLLDRYSCINKTGYFRKIIFQTTVSAYSGKRESICLNNLNNFLSFIKPDGPDVNHPPTEKRFNLSWTEASRLLFLFLSFILDSYCSSENLIISFAADIGVLLHKRELFLPDAATSLDEFFSRKFAHILQLFV